MKLLLFNLATDADDPVLGFTTDWINRLAAHFEHIDVITMRTGRLAVAANVQVYSVGKERGYSEGRRAAEFYRLLGRLTASTRYEACFAHMMPLFAAMSAPILKTRGIPITLWYTHRQNSRMLQVGAAASRRVVTAAPDSFPFSTSKLRVLGHGIDTTFFAPAGLPAHDPSLPFNVVQVARLMPIKHQATLIRAAARLPGIRVHLIGDVPPGIEADYRDDLVRLAGELGIADRVIFAGGQTRDGVLAALRAADAAVNLSPPGLFDKAALESMAVALPTVVSSPAFSALLGGSQADLLLSAPDDTDGLVEKLAHLIALSPSERAEIGMELRRRVIESHSLDGLISRLAAVLLTGEVE